jgi:GTP-binding protein HflX
MTNSSDYADNLMFATLDTNSKRLRFPQEREVIITDTVGFIRDLPDNLKGAFKSTLEELTDADMLLHVVDSTNPLFESHMESVNLILEELKIDTARILTVFNKIDLLEERNLIELKQKFPTAVFISALNRNTYKELLEAIEYTLFIRGIYAKIPVRDHFEKS